MSDSDSSSSWDTDMVCYTADEILRIGLDLAGVKERTKQRAKFETQMQMFVDRYGSNHVVCAQIWEDLQLTTIDKAHLPVENRDKINYFLMAMHFLKRYDVESERSLIYGVSRDTARTWSWYFVEKIQALKSDKITWPEDNYGDDQWIMSVDGVHCWCFEPSHPEWSQDPKYYSHKYASSGYNYELGVSLCESRLIWMNGPFPAGANDISVFGTKGLANKLRSLGKVAIADGAYHAIEYFDVLSTPNPTNDSELVRKFKSRAQRRHESFNSIIKNFECLQVQFRHGMKRFASCFEACCVIAQYQMENGRSLYEIYTKGM